MKQLTNKEHLVYLLNNSHLVTSLPFIDQEIDSRIPKSKIAYLIAAEQQKINRNHMDYVKELALPTLEFVDSEAFEQEVERVKAKIEQKQK
ncbi:MAG: hypothetical protein KDD45_15780 [Bdellovibrionales bacterium]|nr:hypothetical protein [Bdellovibrionales bacterium]